MRTIYMKHPLSSWSMDDDRPCLSLCPTYISFHLCVSVVDFNAGGGGGGGRGMTNRPEKIRSRGKFLLRETYTHTIYALIIYIEEEEHG